MDLIAPTPVQKGGMDQFVCISACVRPTTSVIQRKAVQTVKFSVEQHIAVYKCLYNELISFDLKNIFKISLLR